jgi:hypothetical protein
VDSRDRRTVKRGRSRDTNTRGESSRRRDYHSRERVPRMELR